MKALKTALSIAMLLGTTAMASAQEVHFWYHFDNPENPMDELIAKFEAENPGITVEAENIPWNSYFDNMYTAIAGGNAPDAAQIRLFAQPRLLEMNALEPLDGWIENWTGKADLLDNLLTMTGAPDGKQYLLPVQYVVLYLYYRADLFDAAGLEPPATCAAFIDAARALTADTNGDGQIDQYGFGFRGATGGHDVWGPFVLPGASFDNLATPETIAANQVMIDMFKEGLFPPSSPNDGFQEIIGGFQQGLTAMTVHHIGSANAMVNALGDKVSATVVPECNDGRWTAFGDDNLAVLSSARDKEAAWKWISFLSSSQNNALWNQASGQLPITKSDTESWDGHEQRFVQATVDSLPYATSLPSVPATSDFVGTAWPTAMQRALTGQISSEQMMQELARLYAQN
ncbi:ABC transporter substrate-binding protein [Devosia honganensis]|uniref:ABC transporter substrate-binding protein n=1 Tax=Devosia honganensis TaxID=1610527 RepID=A0ABV7X2N7_9HYPH